MYERVSVLVNTVCIYVHYVCQMHKIILVFFLTVFLCVFVYFRVDLIV